MCLPPNKGHLYLRDNYLNRDLNVFTSDQGTPLFKGQLSGAFE